MKLPFMIKRSGLLLLLFFCSVFTSCDKVEDPLKNEYGFVDDSGNSEKVILLEEFTGVRCTNCPAAAREAKAIQENYPGRVVLVSIHAGFYSSPDSKHPVDLRTPVGNELLDILASGATSFPVGMFSRSGFPDDHLFTSYSGWGGEAAKKLEEPIEANIAGELNYTASDSTYEIKLDVELLKDFEEAEIYVSAFLLEDDIVAPQTDNGEVINDYVQNHVLRASFNGAMGSELANGNLSTGETFTKTFTLTKQQKWVAENCHAIAFIYNRKTYEIIQACEAKL